VSGVNPPRVGSRVHEVSQRTSVDASHRVADRSVLINARTQCLRMPPIAHQELSLLEQGHSERDERHEQRGAGEGVRPEPRRVGRHRAGDEVRLRQYD
jgi:hypothetical protein